MEQELNSKAVSAKKVTIAATCKPPSLDLSSLWTDRLQVPSPSQQSAVKPLLSNVSTANMQANLAILTAFNNRYYKATTGADASKKIQSIAAGVCLNVFQMSPILTTNSTQVHMVAPTSLSLFMRTASSNLRSLPRFQEATHLLPLSSLAPTWTLST